MSFSTAAVLEPASRRSIDDAQCRAQFGRLGDTPFALAGIDRGELADGLFLPVSELNQLRQRAVAALATASRLDPSRGPNPSARNGSRRSSPLPESPRVR